ncbi:beta-1,3-galactosyltransferase 5-like [Penaeus japonicus]|uniref:beta-1,3-galactosyltransferase 5-like n=1 Tax=Penaeus japonicus TaxID=27405 RepID=UPI001C70D057|nr:beta-1,3-galactosyltransferase 5-like [Penaeus japonicus]
MSGTARRFLQMLRPHKYRKGNAFYSGLLVTGATYLICRAVWVNLRAANSLHQIAIVGPDIHKWDFQAGFVREDREGKSKLPQDSVNGKTPHKQALRYLIEEPDICNNFSDIKIVSYVHSAVKKTENRQLIRDTWGSMKYYQQIYLRIVFVFGAAASQEEQDIINEESEKHHDIIQLDFVDSYKNLSYKGVSALQWITEHCMQAQWILKSDDDMIINVFGLVDYLSLYTKWLTSHGEGPPSKIMCAVWWGMPVLRGTGCAKWCVTEEEWPEKSYPTYCSGSAFVIPTRVAPKLYHSYFHAPFLWVDDAYISGVLPRQAGIKHQPIHSLYELNHFLMAKNVIHGNRIFCHHPGKSLPRAAWWPLIAAKEGRG